jgi:hypothetical protein
MSAKLDAGGYGLFALAVWLGWGVIYITLLGPYMYNSLVKVKWRAV